MTTPCDILTLNSGSSSLKFALYRMSAEAELPIARGACERLGQSNGRFWLRDSEAKALEDRADTFGDHRDALQRVFEMFDAHGFPQPGAIGHRLVHGGPQYSTPQRVDASLVEALRRLVPLAPLHLPNELALIEAVAGRLPSLIQVASFDTAFHRAMPELAQRFPLPPELWAEGVRRYGFHGLSYEYVLSVLGPSSGGRTIIAHLGNGASLVAVRDGRPMDTTMGLTPIGGVVMGTRTGDLDPGVLLFLMREKGYDAFRLEELVAEQAGLQGVSGRTSDMKTLLDRRTHDPRAAAAIAMFCYSVRKHLGGLAAVLDGVDTVVFTGGIGERAAEIRWEICKDLEHLGLRLDSQRNADHADCISASTSRCRVRVIPTNEDLQIARHTYAFIRPVTSTT